MTAPKPEWHPPFASNTEPLACPRCGEASIEVRAKDYYSDGCPVEAYCMNCHALLEVQANVDVTFEYPELIDDGC